MWTPLLRLVGGALLAAVLAASAFAQAPKPATSKPRPNHLAWSYRHDRWQTSPRDLIQKWRACTVSFASDDDDTRDGRPALGRLPGQKNTPRAPTTL